MKLREKLEQVKLQYDEAREDYFLKKYGHNMQTLMKLNEFDESFDEFFNENLQKKYNPDYSERNYLSNTDLEEILDDKDLKRLIEFYEEKIEWENF